jgi:hypothetical protein
MRKLRITIGFWLLAFTLCAQTVNTFTGNEVSRTGSGSTQLVGYKARDLSGNALAGFLSISGTDTTAFMTSFSGDGIISNTNNSLKIASTAVEISAKNGSIPAASSLFTLTSTTKGFLAPRMTAAQKTAITSPATGLLIYQTDGTAGFYYYTGAEWSGFGGGITVGATAITGGTSGRIAYNLAGVYQESISYSITPTNASPYNVHLGFGTASDAAYAGTKNLLMGHYAGKNITSGSRNTLLGSGTTSLGGGITTGADNIVIGSETAYISNISKCVVIGNYIDLRGTAENVYIGYGTGSTASYTSSGNYNTGVGSQVWGNGLSGSYNTAMGWGAGYYSTNAISYSIAIGYLAYNTASNQMVVGYTDATGYIGNLYFNGVTSSTPQSITINSASGAGTNIAAANLIFSAGKATGNEAGGFICIKTSDAGASGATLQTATEKARFNVGGDLVLGITSNAKGLVLKSPDGHYWRLSVSNVGVITTADLGTSIP